MLGYSFAVSALTATADTQTMIQESSQQHVAILRLFRKKPPGAELSKE
jgi:hypothetical protein